MPYRFCDETLGAISSFMPKMLMQVAQPYSLFADFYDSAMGKDIFSKVRDIFERLLQRHRIRFSSAADLGCGTGLFARYLNSRWNAPVFGVDFSAAMLRKASENCRDTGVKLIHQDIRRLCLPHCVDLITANFDTVNHLIGNDDLLHLFLGVYKNLNQGGYFIFDIITPCNPPQGTRIYHGSTRNTFKQVIQQIRWSPKRQMLFSEVTFSSPGNDLHKIERHCERTYYPQQVASWLIDAGFVIRDVLDAKTLRKATFCPSRIIVVAQKPANTNLIRTFPRAKTWRLTS
jgi:SAM-dependent methyltransferase